MEKVVIAISMDRLQVDLDDEELRVLFFGGWYL